MSLISEQVKRLRERAEADWEHDFYYDAEILREAADTIEELSAKLAALNMERSERYCEIMDILDKMEFFNQRAGRELWADKPKEVQDKDISDRERDIQKIREYLR